MRTRVRAGESSAFAELYDSYARCCPPLLLSTKPVEGIGNEILDLTPASLQRAKRTKVFTWTDRHMGGGRRSGAGCVQLQGGGLRQRGALVIDD
ncbi:hypothetical protein, partial [Streptomyces sp. NPDC002785]|uniref:hypothetical protein n=1 Tax=Streptomyces sp. NPDC002785 TaxID=3154543 RepID=UPI0033276D3B